MVRAFHFGFVVDFDQDVHRVFARGGFDFGHLRVIECGDDDQDGVGADRAGFGALPWVDHEILADYRQVAGCACGDHVVFVALEIGRVGQDRQACRAAGLVGAGVVGGVEVGADQAF